MPPKALPIEPKFLCRGSQEMLIQVSVVTADGGLLAPRWMGLDLKNKTLWAPLQSNFKSAAKYPIGTSRRELSFLVSSRRHGNTAGAQGWCCCRSPGAS